MAITLLNKQTLKNSISLKVWTPLLQANVQELDSYLREISQENPFLSLKQPSSSQSYYSNESEYIENLPTNESSFYEIVQEQIDAPLFPTPISQKIALDILDDINKEGYFDGDFEEIASKNSTSVESVKKIQQRFMYLEPKGVGSQNFQECLLFQLYTSSIEDEKQKLLEEIIKDIKSLKKYISKKNLDELAQVLKTFSYPPAVNFLNEDIAIIPDFNIEIKDEDLVISYNDAFTNEVVLDNYFRSNNEQISKKIKEARRLVELVNLRKATLHKIVLFIMQRQKDFFENESIKPLTMAELSQEFKLAISTISRAVSNKYISCEKGIYPLKHFFSNEVQNSKLSSQTIKAFLQKLIEKEDRSFPLSDQNLVDIINKELNLKLTRRAITKYRLALEILSSRDRKKLYAIKS